MKLVDSRKVLVEDVKGTSQYDGQQVLKDVHSLPGHYLRTRDAFAVVTSYFDSFNVDYNTDGNPSVIQYYVGISAHLTTIGVLSDENSSLAGTGFILSSGRKEKRYAVYYTVGGVGTPPSLEGVVNLEVPLEPNDTAQIIALATKAALDSTGDFTTTRSNSVLEIEACKLGVTNNTIGINTNFLIQNLAGSDKKVDNVCLTYSQEGHPIWQGQELKNHRYNVYTAKFEVDADLRTEIGSLDSEVVYNKNQLNVIEADTVIWDEINTTFPTISSDLFTYSYQGEVVQTILVTYQNGSKDVILSVIKTRL